MKQWEIWKFPYPSADRPHWFVILSASAWCENTNNATVNGLLCTTLRPIGRPVKSHEVRLDPADGMEWDTVVKCSHIHELPKIRAGECLGSVSAVRQREIARTLRACLALG
jgi:mRNA-degrading endonuclease toxin of MazEF toxin-antitoxin module